MGDLSRTQCDYVALATEGVRGLHPYVPGKPVEELERELGLSNIVKLASNENPLGPSEVALQAARDSMSEWARYPDGNGFVLKQSLASRLDVSPATITLGNGSNDILDLITRAYADAQSEVIFSQYAFAVYALSTQAVCASSMMGISSITVTVTLPLTVSPVDEVATTLTPFSAITFSPSPSGW